MSTIEVHDDREHGLNVEQVTADSFRDVSLIDLLIIFAEHKKTIALVTSAVFFLSVLISLLLPNEFTAIAKIMPPQQNQSLAATLMGQLGGALGALAGTATKDLGLKNPNEIYVGMLTSRSVEDDLIQHFNLVTAFKVKRVSDARKILEKRSDITLEKDGMISISYQDKDKKRAADVANAYVDQLKTLMQRLAVGEASQRRLFFEQQLEDAKNKLADAEVALQLTQQNTGMIDLNSQARAVIESIATIRGQIAAKEVELAAMKSYATSENPQIVLTEQQLSALRDQLAKAETKQITLGKGDVFIPTSQVPQAGVEYVRRMRDVKYYETIFELLARQYEAAKLDEAKNSGIVQVDDAAIIPDRKSFPPRTLIVLVSTMLAFCFALVIAVVEEAYSRLRRDPEQGDKIARLRASLRASMLHHRRLR